MKSLIITDEKWNKIRTSLIEEHGPKIMISWVCQREVGFMIREHTSVSRSPWGVKHDKYIDFVDEQSKTMFVLRYM